MYEVFKAMKSLDFEWKIFNPYHIIVRKKPENPSQEPVSSSYLMQVTVSPTLYMHIVFYQSVQASFQIDPRFHAEALKLSHLCR